MSTSLTSDFTTWSRLLSPTPFHSLVSESPYPPPSPIPLAHPLPPPLPLSFLLTPPKDNIASSLTFSLHKSNHNVSLPTIEDGDWGKYVAPADRLSLETFIATCRLTLIVEYVCFLRSVKLDPADIIHQSLVGGFLYGRRDDFPLGTYHSYRSVGEYQSGS